MRPAQAPDRLGAWPQEALQGGRVTSDDASRPIEYAYPALPDVFHASMRLPETNLKAALGNLRDRCQQLRDRDQARLHFLARIEPTRLQ